MPAVSSASVNLTAALQPLYLIPIGLALFDFGPVAGYGVSALRH